MDFTADDLLLELDRIEATLAEAVARAGQGCNPEFRRRLEGQVRSLRPMLSADDLVLAMDTMEAAERVLDAEDPAAPLLMLAMARKTLGAVLQRQANARRLREAA